MAFGLTIPSVPAELAHRLGLSAVAEGVEDLELAVRMASFGFDLLQGYTPDVAVQRSGCQSATSVEPSVRHPRRQPIAV